jgi:coenzyme F420 hydrogenase subunit beta
MCPDETNELADLSLGDAWLPELRKQSKGESLVIARTETGEQMLQRACAAGVISLFPLTRDKAKATQAAPLKFKKQDFETRLAMLRKGGAKVPRFNPRPEGSRSLFSYVRNLLVLFNVERSEKGTFKTILVGVPFQVLRLYYGIYKVLCAA